MRSSLLLSVVCALVLAMLAVPAHAQATRTWVSGVGDDANPCSRTAPCKTFAGAISKTAPAGEINCLDPGGFGALTITKAIAIKCENGEAGVLVSGTNGITISAGTGDVVMLRGLDFEGLNTSLNGINFLNGKALYVYDCEIRGFNTNGINFAPNNVNALLFVQNTIVDANNGGGILIAPTGGFAADAALFNTTMVRNTFGLRVQDKGKATVFHSVASSNTTNGFLATSTSAAAEINLSHSVSANNGSNGVSAVGASAVIHLVEDTITDNATGIAISSGTVTGTSPGTTLNAGNATPGAPSSSPALQ